MSEQAAPYLGVVGRSGPAFGRAVRGRGRIGWVDRVDDAGVTSAIMELGGLPGDDRATRSRGRLPALPPYDPAKDDEFPIGPVFVTRARRRSRQQPQDAPPRPHEDDRPDVGIIDPPDDEWRPGRARVPGVTQGLFAQLARGCRLRCLALPQSGYVWEPNRRWSFDVVWRPQRVALVVDGGLRIGGRQVPGAGWIRDAQQLNLAAIDGWLVLRVTPAQIVDGTVYDLVARALAAPWRRR